MTTKVIIPERHIFLTSVSEVDSIISPLKSFGITTFSYMRKYNNNQQIYLSSSGGWIKDYYEESLYGQFISQAQHHQKPYYQLFPIDSPLPVFQLARDRHNSSNGITFIKPHENYTNYYFFSGDVNNKALLNFYLNNIDILETFIVYFHDRADILITKSEKSKISLPMNAFANNDNQEQIIVNPALIQQAYRNMRIRKYQFSSQEYRNVKLSSRQLDCIIAYNAGYTAKETAKRFNLSFRTVEKYFDNIKEKLGCDNKKDIIRILTADGFPQKLLCPEEVD